ncbi:MAG: response regulator [Bacteroidia bacterium]
MIDDDEDDQEFFITAVDQLSKSIICTTISRASEALQKLKEKTLNPDLIFLDLNMPIMNGQQFLTEIKKVPILKNLPVIILSTSSHETTIQLMKELGAKDFITKPDSFDKLVLLLKPFLNQVETIA